MINLPESIILDHSPYKHFFGQYHISDQLYTNIINWFKNDAPWKLVKEDFYTQYEFSLLDTATPSFLDFIKSPTYLEELKRFIEGVYEVNLISKFNIVAHKLTKGHVIKIHNDYLDDISIRESHRLLLHFNRDWMEKDGGYCMVFSNEDSNSICQIVEPSKFLLQSFAISKVSYHAVSEVRDGERFTIIFTFYQ